MFEKMNHLNRLFDIYKVLLTPKQCEYIQMYYQEDLSLSEIADEVGVSRTAVHDNIKRTEKLLLSYEEKLNMVANEMKRNTIYNKISASSRLEEINLYVEQLRKIDEN